MKNKKEKPTVREHFDNIRYKGVFFRRIVLCATYSFLLFVLYYGIVSISMYIIPKVSIELLSGITAVYPALVESKDVWSTIVLYYTPYVFCVIGIGILYFIGCKFVVKKINFWVRNYCKKHTAKVRKEIDAYREMLKKSRPVVVEPESSKTVNKNSTENNNKKKHKKKKKRY